MCSSPNLLYLIWASHHRAIAPADTQGYNLLARLIMDVSLQAQLPAPYLSPCIWRWLRAGYSPAWGWRLCFQGPDVAETTRCFRSIAFRMSKFGSNKYYSPPCYEPLPPCWGKHGAGRNSVPGMGGPWAGSHAPTVTPWPWGGGCGRCAPALQGRVLQSARAASR